MPSNKTISIFCAKEQQETEHSLDVAGNGELIFTCGCERFIKLPAGTDAEGVKKYIAAHNKSNVGQLSVEAAEEAKERILADILGE